MRFQVNKKKNEAANTCSSWFQCLLCPVHYKISPGIGLEKDINIFVSRSFFYSTDSKAFSSEYYGKPGLLTRGTEADIQSTKSFTITLLWLCCPYFLISTFFVPFFNLFISCTCIPCKWEW